MKKAAGVLCLIALVLSLLTACAARHTPALSMDVPKGKWILIEVDRKRLTLYQGKEALHTYTVATGTRETPTPLGTYRINSRFASEMSGFGTRFLGINVPWGQFGMHGTNKPSTIGSNASHGCVRMFVKDSEALYAAVPNGTRVVIEGGPYGLLDHSLKPLSPGDRGSHVKAMQERLRQLGHHTGSCDGVYGQATAYAVRQARKAYALPDAQNADYAFFRAIGLILFE